MVSLFTRVTITGSLVSSELSWYQPLVVQGRNVVWSVGVPWLCGSQLLATCGYSLISVSALQWSPHHYHLYIYCNAIICVCISATVVIVTMSECCVILLTLCVCSCVHMCTSICRYVEYLVVRIKDMCVCTFLLLSITITRLRTCKYHLILYQVLANNKSAYLCVVILLNCLHSTPWSCQSLRLQYLLYKLYISYALYCCRWYYFV